MVPPNDIFGFISTWVGVYSLLAAFVVVSSYVLYKRVLQLILLGKPENRFDHPARRLLKAIEIVLGQAKVLQSLSLKDRAGIGHAVVFWGFLSFFLSYVIFIFGDTLWPRFSETVLTATGVRIYATYLDFVAILILASLVWALLRRWVISPRRLSFDITRSPDAVVIVAAIAALMTLTLATEAFFVSSGGKGPAAQAAIGNFLGTTLSNWGLSERAASSLYQLTWWAHLLLIFGFGIYIPFSKHMHMMAAPANAFFHRLVPRGTLRPMPDLESAERFGVGQVEDFTWKELLDGYACAVCGRCTDVCPANISGKTLSPMHIIEGVKDHLLSEGPRVLRGDPTTHPLIGGVISEEALWDCVTCGACIQECPVAIEHIDSIVDMRRFMVMEQGNIPDTGLQALQSMEQRGHPWRGTQFTRTDWYQGIDIKVLGEAVDPQVDVLLWVGCTPALEQRSQAIAKAAASLLKRAHVNFGILGPEETCTGDPARRMGNEYLYLTLARKNIENLNRYGVTTILTLCPHCFNTLKNEYPQLGGQFNVLHYTEYMAELVQQGRLKPVKTIETEVAYHDSCYLGRHNGIYDAPRMLANSIPGVSVTEMAPHCRERGFCCGAGGGHMWLEESGGQRINHVRTEQFLQTGADTIGVSCPFCLQMMEEGISATGKQGQRRALDIVELLAESVGEDVSTEM